MASVGKYLIKSSKIQKIVYSILFIAFGIFFFALIGPKTIKIQFEPYEAEYLGTHTFTAYEAIEEKSDNKTKYSLSFKNAELGITVTKKVTFDEYREARFKGAVEFDFDVFKISNGEYYCSKNLGINTEQAVKDYKAELIGYNWGGVVFSIIFVVVGIGLLIYTLRREKAMEKESQSEKPNEEYTSFY